MNDKYINKSQLVTSVTCKLKKTVLLDIMRIGQTIFILLIASFTYGQGGPTGKYINDRLNESTYIIFNSDSTFRYRYAVCLLHDIACGQYEMHNDTIIFQYLTDMRDTCCNKEIDADFHYDSTIDLPRPDKLFYKDEKLYEFRNGKVQSNVLVDSRPSKFTEYHRKYLLFGKFVIDDAYYMITESKVKWKKNKQKASW